MIYHLDISDPEKLQLQLPYEITEFRKSYQKVLKTIRIEKHTESDIGEENLKWDTIKSFFSNHENYLFVDDLLSVIYFFTKTMDSTLLETYLTNIILFHYDPTEREKYIDSLNLESPYNVLKKIFGTASYLTHREIKRVINFMDTEDFLIKKAIFTYIRQKDRSYDINNFQDIYKNLKGKEPFSVKELQDLKYSITTWDVFFEFFFKQYYHTDIKEKIEDVIDLEKVVKLEIPINPNAYNLNLFSNETKDFILKKFHDDLRLILNSCKRVIYHESRRVLGIRLENLIVSFDYSASEDYLEELKTSNVYYDNRQDLLLGKIGICNWMLKTYDKDDTPSFWFYCIFEGNYIELKGYQFSLDNIFGIKDINENTIECRIRRYKSYFKQFELGSESSLIVQAFLHLEFKKKEKDWIIDWKQLYLDIIDITFLDEFKPISITLGKKGNGVIKLENTPKGLRKYRYYKRGEPSYDIILHKPIHLSNLFKGENEIFFDVTIGKKRVCKTKPDLCTWIETETNFASTSGKDLKDAISNVLFAYEKEYNLKPLPMFHTAGVFLKDDDFMLVHPFKEGLTVIGENDIQHEYIEHIKEKGIDFDGILTNSFYKILQIKGMREDIRAGIYGFASIHPFFFALSKVLDIFPNVFIIGIHGSGKTTLAEICFNYLYGTKMRSPDSIDSPARITKYSTESTFSLNIDDIDILDPKLMNFIKTNSTRKGTRDRLTRDQKMISEQTYTAYIGTANNRNFLSGNENDAFRKRCLIFETMEEIEFKEDFTHFESNRLDIAEGKIYGFFLIEKAKEFFNTLSTKDISTYFKLTAHINKIKRKIKERIIEKFIQLSDARRLTIYALIYIGWEIWRYIFKKKKIESSILDNYLDFNQDHFWNFIKNLEETERDITITTFDSILEFFEQNKDKLEFNNKKTIKGKIFLQTRFIEQYDKFARQRGYDTLKNLKEFAHLQSQILGFDIKPGTKHIRTISDGTAKNEYGCIFHYDEICKERCREIENSSSSDENKKGISEFINKVREIFRDNQNQSLDKDGLYDILELYFEERQFIDDALDYLFDNEIIVLDEIDDSKCVFNDPDRIEKEKLDDQEESQREVR